VQPDAELEGGFTRRAVAWITGIVLASLTAGALLSAFGEKLESRPSSGPNTFSRSAVGHRALAELLRQEGLGVVSRGNSREGRPPGPHRPLVLAEPYAGTILNPARLQALRDEAARRKAPLVLVLPKWDSVEDPRHSGWIGDVALRPARDVEQVAKALDVKGLANVRIERRRGAEAPRECRARLGGPPEAYRIDLRPAQLIRPGPGLDPIVVCGGELLVARVKQGEGTPAVFLVADPDILENHGLGRADHAQMVDDLLVRGLEAQGVIFDETIHGLAHQAGLLAEALRFPLVLAVLQSALLAGVIVWAGVGRFGKPLPVRGFSGDEEPGDGPEILIDNTARLLSVSTRGGGHAAESLARYYRQTVRAVAAACFLPPDLPEDELVERLQKIAHSRGSRMQLRSFARRVEQVAAAGPAARDRAVRLARILHRWRREMTLRNLSEAGDGHRKHP
jgi:hypothetical protein